MVKEKIMEAVIVVLVFAILVPCCFTVKKGRELFYSEKNSPQAQKGPA